MSTPEQTNPPNPQPPHAATQPSTGEQQQRTPVIINQDNSDLAARVNELGRTLAKMPEQIVNSFREATQAAQAPQQQTPVQQVQQGGQNTQAPGTDNNPTSPSTPSQGAQANDSGTSRNGPKVSKFASWWYKRS